MHTCPMHPEIQQEAPGRCPKCSMRLVPAGTAPKAPPMEDRGLGALTWKSYLPLIAIFSVILLATAAVSLLDYRAGTFSIFNSVIHFMTGFFLIFAGFKLMDLRGFAEGYSTYDLLAQRVFAYSYVYPFIELGFGLAMLAGIQTDALLISEIAVMSFSGLGVLIKILKREPVKCVCLGTILKVPLTTVTLIEDFGMAALALLLLLK